MGVEHELAGRSAPTRRRPGSRANRARDAPQATGRTPRRRLRFHRAVAGAFAAAPAGWTALVAEHEPRVRPAGRAGARAAARVETGDPAGTPLDADTAGGEDAVAERDP